MTIESSILCAQDEVIDQLVAEQDEIRDFFSGVLSSVRTILEEGIVYSGLADGSKHFDAGDAVFITKLGRIMQLRAALGLTEMRVL